MAVEDDNPETLVASKPIPRLNDVVSQTSSSYLPPASDAKPTDVSPKKPLSPREFFLSVASKMASQPLPNSDPDVWGVLTAISNNARKRCQGINMLLTEDEHCIGRLVEDPRFQIESNAISANHCRIYRTRVATENMESVSNSNTLVFLKDTSTNGTYVNWEKLKKNGAAVKVCHGDIISFAAPPQYELAFAFVFREVLVSTPLADNAVAKRKAEEFVSENKRLKGIGIGAPEGPISLDDFRSLQQSNMELRKQLENQVHTIVTLHKENRAAVECHENEMRAVKESVTKSYLDQLKELHNLLEIKQKELGEVNKVSAEQKHAMEDLNERLSASMQSFAEANAIINCQKANVAELKEQLDEQQSQQREEREKAAADLKAAVQRAHSEAQEELKRLSDAALRREIELQEVINKLQESKREWCLLVETLRSKLEETRQKLVTSDNKVRQLETQAHDELLASANGRKRVEELEHETRRLRKELELEKAAREEAWAKVSVLELEINAAMRDLDFERRGLKAARERIMLRETQLRAFYSTTEEISLLFAKQQEQLKAMQRTLEDEENYENTSVDMDINTANGAADGTIDRGKEVTGYCNNSAARAGSATSAQKFHRDQVETSSNEASVTEKHDSEIRSQECQNTQVAEFTSTDNDHGVKGSFGSEIDGSRGAPVMDGDAVGTERVLETESPVADREQKIDLIKCSALDEDTMQFDEAHVQETEEHGQTISLEALHHTQSNNPVDSLKPTEDTEGTIRTADLLASEVAGSWACSTAPSVHGENESPRSGGSKKEGAAALLLSSGEVAESQSSPSSEDAATRQSHERQALTEMIGIVAPDLKELFGVAADDGDHEREKDGYSSDPETERYSNTGSDNEVNVKGGSISDAETECSDQVEEDQRQDDTMEEADEATQEDSLG
ncbi:SMAD/FHA domain-containing protein, putative isoform 1 [Quillaja saponaria]|uniref:SMAD/FHA domain-containing protein, putative isoform 1 n=1 Tax=Quillaja saponaria TaxID=32244 RepID=A0AAD7PPF3_QUISA|nr:SMAD/FHA domain-containing protein, putative isoform 1 [Quillaja saponaria]